MDCGDTRLQLCPVRSSRGDLVMPPCRVNRGFISGLSERMGGLGILGTAVPVRRMGLMLIYPLLCTLMSGGVLKSPFQIFHPIGEVSESQRTH